jgi:SAM-dependent methyltransferase
MFSKFFALNKRLSNSIKRYLPQARADRPATVYEKTVAQYMNSRRNQVVVDVGSGKQCHFAKYRDPAMGTRIIGVDVSEEEMAGNQDVDEKRVANITKSMPFECNQIDVIAGRFVLEHLKDVENFVSLCSQVLKQDGYFILLFPSKFAPFALINQALPTNVSQRLLYFIRPETRGGCGFTAYYNKCYYSAIKRLLGQHGFELVNIRYNYYQSNYFSFFVPLFLISSLYEILLQMCGAKNLCPYLLVVAQKRGAYL